MATFIFFGSLILIFYTIAGYPILLALVSFFKKKPVKKKEIIPDVTMIIPVYNEASTIAEKIQNCIEIDYPPEKLQIIVVSDASTDQTGSIVASFPNENILFIDLPLRSGKVSAQNYAVQFCRAPIIIFTDVAIMVKSDAVKRIVQNFHDPDIGAVSCRDAIVDAKLSRNREKDYIQYDMLVRKYTSKIGTLIGVTGGFYAVRSHIAEGGWNPAFPPDFYVALRCIKKGMRVIEDPEVIAYYKTTSSGSDELKRKVRTINRGMHALFSTANIHLLNPFRYGFAAIELISQKLLRWLLPVLFLLFFVSNIFVFHLSILTKITMSMQLFLYGAGIYGFFAKKTAKLPIFVTTPFFFLIANISILTALVELMKGKKYVMWQPTKR